MAENTHPQQRQQRRLSLPYLTTSFTLRDTHNTTKLYAPHRHIAQHVRFFSSSKLQSNRKETHSQSNRKETHSQLNKETHSQSNMKETHSQSNRKETHSQLDKGVQEQLGNEAISQLRSEAQQQLLSWDDLCALDNCADCKQSFSQLLDAASALNVNSLPVKTAERLQSNWRLFSSRLEQFVQQYSKSSQEMAAKIPLVLDSAVLVAPSLALQMAAHICRAYHTSINLKDGENALRMYNQALVAMKQWAKEDSSLLGFGYVIFFCRGLSNFQLSRLDLAISNFDQSIRDEDLFPYPYVNRAFAHYASNQSEKAEADFERAVALDEPHKDEVYLSRGLFYQYTWKKPHLALEDFTKAIEYNPANDTAYLCRGRLKFEDFDDPIAALQDFDKVIELNPTQIVAYVNRAMIYFEFLSEPEKALADYETVLRLDSNHVHALIKRGQIQSEVFNNAELAIQSFDKAIELSPNNSFAYNYRAITNAKLNNDPVGALQDFHTAISLDPENSDAYNDRGWLYLESTKEYEKALKDFSKAIRIDKQFTIAYNNRGLTLRALNRNAEAMQDFSTAINLDPYFAMSYINRAALNFEVMQNPQEALKDLSKGIRYVPDDPKLYIARAVINKEGLQNFESAEADLKMALQLQGQPHSIEKQ